MEDESPVGLPSGSNSLRRISVGHKLPSQGKGTLQVPNSSVDAVCDPTNTFRPDRWLKCLTVEDVARMSDSLFPSVRWIAGNIPLTVLDSILLVCENNFSRVQDSPLAALCTSCLYLESALLCLEDDWSNDSDMLEFTLMLSSDDSANSVAVFLGSLLLALKWLDDWPWKTNTFLNVLDPSVRKLVSPKELNTAERLLFGALDYQLHFSQFEYVSIFSELSKFLN